MQGGTHAAALRRCHGQPAVRGLASRWSASGPDAGPTETSHIPTPHRCVLSVSPASPARSSPSRAREASHHSAYPPTPVGFSPPLTSQAAGWPAQLQPLPSPIQDGLVAQWESTALKTRTPRFESGRVHCIARRTPLAPYRDASAPKTLASLRVCGPVRGHGLPGPDPQDMMKHDQRNRIPDDSTGPGSTESRVREAKKQLRLALEAVRLETATGRIAAQEIEDALESTRIADEMLADGQEDEE